MPLTLTEKEKCPWTSSSDFLKINLCFQFVTALVEEVVTTLEEEVVIALEEEVVTTLEEEVVIGWNKSLQMSIPSSQLSPLQ